MVFGAAEAAQTPNIDDVASTKQPCEPRFVIHGFLADRKSVIFEVWAAPAFRKIFPKVGGGFALQHLEWFSGPPGRPGLKAKKPTSGPEALLRHVHQRF
jgi:hypothetical protein